MAEEPDPPTGAAIPQTGTPPDDAEAAQQPPASPPLPAKHVPVTPGPRATGLREVYKRALSHTLERVSWDNVAACYPTIAARAPATLRAVQGQMVELLREKCNVCLFYFILFFFWLSC